jgi:hypothetical protein
MRRQGEFFGETELELVYIAKRLREALKIENFLTAAQIDYLAEPGSYVGGLLFQRELTGAFFYVPVADLERTRQLLLEQRYKPYEAGPG